MTRRNFKVLVAGGLTAAALMGAAGTSFAVSQTDATGSSRTVASAETANQTIAMKDALLYDAPNGEMIGTASGRYVVEERDGTGAWIKVSDGNQFGWVHSDDPGLGGTD